MQRTAVFRRQHEEILEVASDLSSALASADEVAKDSAIVLGLLTVLAGRIMIHLAMEDKGLYPRLLRHGKSEVRDLAGKYMVEMGGIKDVFAAYVGRWPDGSRIAAAPAAFIDETRAILAALSRRIACEDGELYPLVDREG